MVHEERKQKAASSRVVEVVVYGTAIHRQYPPTDLNDLMFLIVAEVESTCHARKPVEISRLLLVNGGTPPHNLANVSPKYTGGKYRSARALVLVEKA